MCLSYAPHGNVKASQSSPNGSQMNVKMSRTCGNWTMAPPHGAAEGAE
jgi:hypothetical protein